MKTIKLLVPMAMILVGSILWQSCKKENVQSKNVSTTFEQNNSKIFNPRGGDLWYYGTLIEGVGCRQPCGPFCHFERNDDPFAQSGLDHGIGHYSLQANNLISAEIDISALNPEHINAWSNSGVFEIQQTTEIPYQTVTEVYNDAGITQGIPHFFLPQGNWPINFSNGTGNQKMIISFIDMNTIQVNVEQ